MGVGVTTNPLQGGGNIPLILLPDVAWYGENVYFDNGELGYQWLQSKQYAMEVFTSLNQERRYFSFWHPANLFAPLEGNAAVVDERPGFVSTISSRQVSVDEIRKRKWSVDAGIRWHRYFSNSELSIAIATDISDVHRGHQASLRYSRFWQTHGWNVAVTPSLNWKSQNLVDYYYGLRADDNVGLENHYTANGGWSRKLAISASYPLSEEWQLLVKGSYQWLNRGMYMSPLVKDKSVRSLFVGVSHSF